MKNFSVFLLVLGALAVSGCAESTRPVATGTGNIRALNAAVTTPDIAFLLEERAIGLTGYKESTARSEFDDLEYTANFDYRFSGDPSPSRLASVPFKLEKDTGYLFIFIGSLAAPDALTWENPVRTWEDTETVIEIRFGHLSPQLGEVDMYFAAPGTAPVLGEAQATLTFGNHSAVFELPEGAYEYIITSKDDPADILFKSRAITYLPRAGYLISTFDSDPSITSAISVRAITRAGASTELANVNAPPVLRTFHGAITAGPFDLYRDGDFSTPWIANVAYAEISAAVETPIDVVTYTFTAAGNAGAILHEEDFAIFDGHRSTRFLLGTTPALTTLLTIDNIRPFEDSTKLRFVQASSNQPTVDVYLVAAGTDITDVPPRFFSLPFLRDTGYITIIANDYEVYVTKPTTKDIMAGPFAFTATDGDVVHFAIADTVDPNLLQLVNYDHLSIAP
jgi:Domain of unknown function (DUF4397)